MRRPRILAEAALVLWMGLAIALYVLVTVPADGALAGALPDLVMRMRDVVFPLFYSRSLLS